MEAAETQTKLAKTIFNTFPMGEYEVNTAHPDGSQMLLAVVTVRREAIEDKDINKLSELANRLDMEFGGKYQIKGDFDGFNCDIEMRRTT